MIPFNLSSSGSDQTTYRLEELSIFTVTLVGGPLGAEKDSVIIILYTRIKLLLHTILQASDSLVASRWSTVYSHSCNVNVVGKEWVQPSDSVMSGYRHFTPAGVIVLIANANRVSSYDTILL